MFIRLLLMILFISFLPHSIAQISLNECTFLLEQDEADPLYAPGDGRLLAFISSEYKCPRYAESSPFSTVVTEVQYRNMVIDCNHNGGGQVGCRARQICNYLTNPPLCTDMISSREDADGTVLFNSGANRSGCLAEAGQNLATLDPSDVTFHSSADGINEHCRDIVRLYQLQAGRRGAGGNVNDFNLPTNTTGP